MRAGKWMAERADRAAPPSARASWIAARAAALVDERQGAAARVLDRIFTVTSAITGAAVIGVVALTTDRGASIDLAALAQGRADGLAVDLAVLVVALGIAGAPLLLLYLRPGGSNTPWIAAGAQIAGALALVHQVGASARWILIGSLVLLATSRRPGLVAVVGGLTLVASRLDGEGGHDALLADLGLAALVLGLVGLAAAGRRELLAHARDQVEAEDGQRTRAEMERLAALAHLAAALGGGLHPRLAAIRRAEARLRGHLADRSDTDEVDAEALFDRIEGELDAAEALVRDLVDQGRGREPMLTPVAVDRLLEEVVEVVRGRAGVDVIVRGDARIPEVEVDPDLLRTVVKNLVQNAIEAIPAGRRGRVELAAGSSDERWWLTVEDDGVGVAPAARRRIFEPFVTHKARAVGLGLPVAAEIVRRHGGTLRVDRGPAGGARFTAEFRRSPERSE